MKILGSFQNSNAILDYLLDFIIYIHNSATNKILGVEKYNILEDIKIESGALIIYYREPFSRFINRCTYSNLILKYFNKDSKLLIQKTIHRFTVRC